MKIDFVSDIACPWCAVGLNSLERALEKTGAEIPVELHFHPFELNPDMRREGTDAVAYLRQKFGMSDEQVLQGRSALRARGAAVGFRFGDVTRVWNTFDAHRLLYWAGQQSPELQRKLKHGFLNAYHGAGRDPGDPQLMLELAVQAGLDQGGAKAVIDSDRYTNDVRTEEQYWQKAGVRAVPSIILNDQHLITGGQSPDVFEKMVRDIAAGSTA